MKRITSILKDNFGFIGTAAILGLTILMTTRASAQDIYEIEQTFDQPFNMLHINKGWDVRLFQAPTGSPTTVVLQTRCAEFFEEGNEPQIIEMKKFDKKDSWLYLKPNTSMPHSTVVEIHTAQPIDEIHLYNDARLTIAHYDFDSVNLDVYIDTNATLVIDTMNNRWSTSFTLHDATLDLRHFSGRHIHLWTYGNSTVTAGKINAFRFWQRLSANTKCDIASTDSVQHLFVKHRKPFNNAANFTSLSLTFGLDVSSALQGTDDARYGSPYNTLGEFGIYEQLCTNSVPLGGRWSWHPGLELAYRVRLLDNVVKADAGHLVLDDSYGALVPQQYLDYFTIGLPVTLNYTFDKKWHTFAKGFYFKLTPMYNCNQELVTQTLNEHNHWVTRHDKDLDVLNRFNLRTAVGLNLGMLGFHSIEFFMDLFPTYKASAGAPQTRMFGVLYHF